MKIIVNSVSALESAASSLLSFAKNDRFFVINGPMGAGKTTFTKALCLALGVKENVSSPTFSIVNEYLGAETAIYHFDFYRIKSIAEAYDIGYEDYFFGEGVCIIEWAEKVESLLPDTYTQVDIEILGDNQRQFEFTNVGLDK